MYPTTKRKYCRRCGRPHSVRVIKLDAPDYDHWLEQWYGARCECGRRLTRESTTSLPPHLQEEAR